MIRVCTDPFDPGAELSVFETKAGAAGAVVSFIGKVREAAGDSAVTGLYLEHYPGVTERSIAEIKEEAAKRWAIDDVLIIHRVGELGPGEPIVMVCVAAAHRRDAFEAADFLMDYLKTEAMFWKKEIREDGEAWIEPRDADYKDAARWKDDEEE
ncbi:molybdenum cofactor biosynthesis protein MoaE [Hyphococcus luteus]|uniref:Molybdopterin synthase catalytic subunit n=1 Tax=Hyphococcus luteus TaxID=2058213 RepID=A0A2S7K326_9PROT|nr:molybdenum cofactor biosynthesis protein MoaE [Marinicaulis flavus]PQA86903.1 molybdenum cofactor biosynthesis protein MoaE [Marinicaulis flavus]